jgi:hypothetical protein
MIQSSVECVATSRSSKSPRNSACSPSVGYISPKSDAHTLSFDQLWQLSRSPGGQRFGVSDPGDRSHPILESPERCPLFQLLSQSGCKKLRLAPGQGEQLRAHRFPQFRVGQGVLCPRIGAQRFRVPRRRFICVLHPTIASALVAM